MENFFSHLAPLVEQTNGELKQRYKAGDLERYEEFTETLLGRREPAMEDPRQRNGRPSRFWFPGLTAKPWHDLSDAAWLKTLESSHEEIRNEFLAAIGDTAAFGLYMPSVGEGGVEFDFKEWKAFYLYRLGNNFEENQSRCPRTTTMIKTSPVATEVMFTVLHGGGYTAAHCSDFNAKLTCHLGLVVPPDCHISVASEVRTWEEGRCLIFDDTYEHEVWNNSQSFRGILLMDVWHPELTEIEIASLEYLSGKLAAAGLFSIE
jgi:aspartyl/asparaginyl beta-hydroxylase (cupin superfamily)